MGFNAAEAGNGAARMSTKSFPAGLHLAVEGLVSVAKPVHAARQVAVDRRRREAELIGKLAESRRKLEESRRQRADKEKAAVLRERQMLEEIAQMRRLAEQGDGREGLMVKLTVASVTFGALSFAAAVVAVFA